MATKTHRLSILYQVSFILCYKHKRTGSVFLFITIKEAQHGLELHFLAKHTS